MAEAGWLGIAMPEEFGGAGLGITEAAVMMQAVAERAAACAAASAIHGPVFGLEPRGAFRHRGTEAAHDPAGHLRRGQDVLRRHRAQYRARHHQPQDRAPRSTAAIGVNGEKIWIIDAQVADKMLLLARTTPLEEVKKKTEGLTLFYTKLDREQDRARLIHKMGRQAVDSNMLFINDLFVPEEDRIGEEGAGLPHSPERPQSGARAAGRRSDRHRPRARSSGRRNMRSERIVFGRPIGQNQGIQHPLAKCWMQLEAAEADGDEGRDTVRPAARSAASRPTPAKFLAARVRLRSLPARR